MSDYWRSQDLEACLERIEAKLDRLLAALAGDDQDEPSMDLDGNPLPRERQEGEPL